MWELGAPTTPNQFFSTMSITLTANYKEVLDAVTVDKIDELLDENYALDDMLEFIDAHNTDDFCNFYEEYVLVRQSVTRQLML